MISGCELSQRNLNRLKHFGHLHTIEQRLALCIALLKCGHTFNDEIFKYLKNNKSELEIIDSREEANSAELQAIENFESGKINKNEALDIFILYNHEPSSDLIPETIEITSNMMSPNLSKNRFAEKLFDKRTFSKTPPPVKAVSKSPFLLEAENPVPSFQSKSASKSPFVENDVKPSFSFQSKSASKSPFVEKSRSPSALRVASAASHIREENVPFASLINESKFSAGSIKNASNVVQNEIENKVPSFIQEVKPSSLRLSASPNKEENVENVPFASLLAESKFSAGSIKTASNVVQNEIENKVPIFIQEEAKPKLNDGAKQEFDTSWESIYDIQINDGESGFYMEDIINGLAEDPLTEEKVKRLRSHPDQKLVKSTVGEKRYKDIENFGKKELNINLESKPAKERNYYTLRYDMYDSAMKKEEGTHYNLTEIIKNLSKDPLTEESIKRLLSYPDQQFIKSAIGEERYEEIKKFNDKELEEEFNEIADELNGKIESELNSEDENCENTCKTKTNEKDIKRCDVKCQNKFKVFKIAASIGLLSACALLVSTIREANKNTTYAEAVEMLKNSSIKINSEFNNKIEFLYGLTAYEIIPKKNIINSKIIYEFFEKLKDNKDIIISTVSEPIEKVVYDIFDKYPDLYNDLVTTIYEKYNDAWAQYGLPENKDVLLEQPNYFNSSNNPQTSFTTSPKQPSLKIKGKSFNTKTVTEKTIMLPDGDNNFDVIQNTVNTRPIITSPKIQNTGEKKNKKNKNKSPPRKK